MGEEGPNNTLPVLKKKKKVYKNSIRPRNVYRPDVCIFRLTVLVMHISVTTVVRENEEDKLGL